MQNPSPQNTPRPPRPPRPQRPQGPGPQGPQRQQGPQGPGPQGPQSQEPPSAATKAKGCLTLIILLAAIFVIVTVWSKISGPAPAPKKFSEKVDLTSDELSNDEIALIKTQAEMYLDKVDGLSKAKLPLKPNIERLKTGAELGGVTYKYVYKLTDRFEHNGVKHDITMIIAVADDGTKLLAYKCPDTGRDILEDYKVIDR